MWGVQEGEESGGREMGWVGSEEGGRGGTIFAPMDHVTLGTSEECPLWLWLPHDIGILHTHSLTHADRKVMAELAVGLTREMYFIHRVGFAHTYSAIHMLKSTQQKMKAYEYSVVTLDNYDERNSCVIVS